ncbi:MAG: flagellar export chaperone FlgN [Candidatus Eiseniibacteriota bacterium]
MNARSFPAVTPADADLEALTSSLARELALVRELRDALRHQRGGIAANRTDMVEDSIQQVGRILVSLEEQRRGRSQLLESMSGAPAESMSWIDALPTRPIALDGVRRELRDAAREVAHEVAVNHEVLRRSVEAGEAYLQALFSSVRGVEPCYRPGEATAAEPATGVIMNRRA